jgi:uncharacterized protein YkwD
VPRTLGQAAGFVIGFWIALWLSPFVVKAAPLAADPESYLEELEGRLASSVNATRAGSQLIPLERRDELDRVARAHSEDMARRGYLAHETPEGSNPLDRLRAAGLDGFTLAAENVGKTNLPEPNREILHGWLGSRDHRRNLLAPPFNATGIGVARTADGTYYYTQVYLTYPRADSAPGR